MKTMWIIHLILTPALWAGILSPFFGTEKLKLREVKQVAQGHMFFFFLAKTFSLCFRLNKTLLESLFSSLGNDPISVGWPQLFISLMLGTGLKRETADCSVTPQVQSVGGAWGGGCVRNSPGEEGTSCWVLFIQSISIRKILTSNH